MRILFLCTANSLRSQMAEGWARHLWGGRIEAHSAGLRAPGLNPKAVQVMAEAGVDISGQRSKTVAEFEGREFDLVVTVCGGASESCPAWLGGKARRIHIPFEDVTGEDLAPYRRLRDQIRDFCRRLPDVMKELPR